MMKRIWGVLFGWVVLCGLCSQPLLAANVPTAQEIAAMSSYDGRDYGIVTAVKDQGNSNLCWAYSSVTATETSILRSGIDRGATAQNLNLNPRAAAYNVFNRGVDPLGNTDAVSSAVDYTTQSGNPYKIATVFASWWGPTANAPGSDPHIGAEYRLENAFYLPETSSISDIKQAVAEYGAVTFQYNNMRNAQYYNPKNEGGSQSYPHACTVIGWDDNIPAANFLPGGASRDGGWLIKNSYNDWEYFYLSYDNTSSVMYAFDYVTADEYAYNYHYDGSVDDFALANDKCVANIYCAQMGGTDDKAEFLRAVNVGVNGSDYTLEVTVYTGLKSASSPVEGGVLAATKRVHLQYGGLVTVHLDEAVELEQGSYFAVVARVVDGNATIRECLQGGKNSFVASASSWTKLTNRVGRIKALTVLDEKPVTVQPDKKVAGNFTNLLVFCKFADEQEFIDKTYAGAKVSTILDNSYNKSIYSVADYLKVVSGGKLQMDILYLFAADGGSFTLAHKRGYYAPYDAANNLDGYKTTTEKQKRFRELKDDWSAAVQAAIDAGQKPQDAAGNTYGFAELDKHDAPDLGHEFDLMTIIYQPGTVSITADSPLWDYQAYFNEVNVTVDGVEYRANRYVQLTANYATALYKGADGLPILATGKICHETMHALGLKDLYYSSGDVPVAQMSLMGQHTSPVGQYVSVKERESLGWLGAQQMVTLPYDGEYKLVQAAGSGVVAYKKDLAGGQTLYLEYRRFDENGNKYDNQRKEIYSCADGAMLTREPFKSGLVCYLVKTGVDFPQNLGNKNLEMVLVSDANHNAMANWALSAGETMKISDTVSVSVKALDDGELTFSISGIGAAPIVPEPNPNPNPEKTPHNIGTFAANVVNVTYGDTPGGQTVLSTTGAVKYSSSASAVVSVDENSGAVTIHKAGTVVISALVAEDDEHTANSTSYILNVAKKQLEIVGLVAQNRTFAANNVTVALSGGTLKGVVGTDDVSVVMPTVGTMADDKVGDNKAVSVPELSLQGAAAENYTLRQPAGITVNITKAESGNIGGGGGGGGGGSSVTTKKDDTTKKDEVKDEIKTEDKVEEKADNNTYSQTFTDVAADSYYANAVKWAVEKCITTGATATEFAPNNVCTSAQIVTFLYRAAGKPEVSGTANFGDVSASDYYAKAVAWAVEKGITTGINDRTFAPRQTCTRAEAVTFLWRAAGKPEVDGAAAFDDVAAEAWFAAAVKWAEDSEITGGISDGLFGANDECTRAQIVTFLFRSAE